MKELKSLYENFLTEKAELDKRAQDLFKSITFAFFDANPNIKAIVWEQYAPYFNDGEPCEFSVYEPTFANTDDIDILSDIRSGEYDGDDESIQAFDSYSVRYLKPEFLETIDMEQVEFMSSMIQSSTMEPILRQLLGEDATVIATREGFTTKECRHD